MGKYWHARGKVCLKVSMVQLGCGEGDGKMRPEEQQPAHMGPRALKVRSSDPVLRVAGSRRRTLSKRNDDVFWKYSLAAGWGMGWRRRGWKLGAQ